MRRTIFSLTLCFALGACNESAADKATSVSVIGDRTPIVAAATAQGLVAFDADGQIEPALAERWIVNDDGLHLVFRLVRTTWSNGKPVLAGDVARSMNENIAQASQGRLGHLFSTIEEVVPMTDHIVDIRLKAPRPNLLQLLAAPEFGIRHAGFGTGPYLAVKNTKSVATLQPLRATDGSDDGVTDEQLRARGISVHGDTAALAITRYSHGRAQAVLGGSFIDYPLVQTAQIRPSQIVIDRPQGLFGLAFVSQKGLVGGATLREALSMAIDRVSLAKTLGLPGFAPRETILPSVLDQSSAPAAPDWAGAGLDVRRAEAAKRVSDWAKSNSAAPTIKIALPDGPGARLLFARLAADWRTIGVRAIMVHVHDAADLRLVDEVAPNDSVNWYFSKLSCDAGVICTQSAQSALNDARNADTLPARASAYSEVDRAYGDFVPFIPLANPFRWSLTSVQLPGLRPTSTAYHPLLRLRAAKI